MSEAEEYGYDGTYFMAGSPSKPYSMEGGGYIASSPPNSRKHHRKERQVPTLVRANSDQWQPEDEDHFADVIFFDYGRHY
jgi:hypothetical protein